MSLALGALAVLTAAPGCKKTELKWAPPATRPTTRSAAALEVRLPSIVAIGPRLPIADDGYWLSVRRGAEQAAKELGVTLDWRSPPADISLAALPGYVSSNISGCDAAMIAPENQETLAPTIAAEHKKMPVVCLGLQLSTDQVTATVRIDQAKAGEMAAEQLAAALGSGGGKIAIIGIVHGPTAASPVTANRAASMPAATGATAMSPSSADAPVPATTAMRIERWIAFEKAIKAHPNVQVIVQPDSPLVVSAAAPLDGARSELQAHPDLAGIFCLDAVDANAVLQAVNEGILSGQLKSPIKIVACGSSPQLKTAVADKQVSALIVESGQDVGYQGLKTAVAALRNQPFASQVLLTPRVLTIENVDRADVQKGSLPPAPAAHQTGNSH